MNRRDFLRGTIASSAGLGLGKHLTGADQGAQETAPAAKAPPTKAGPAFSISLAQWSLHKSLFGSKLKHLDFAQSARGFGLDAIEYVNTFFKDKAKDPAYLGEMKTRADGEGVRSLLIMCDGEGDLGNPDAEARTRAIENHYRWVEAARFLGCHSIRVNAKSQGSYEEQRDRAADGLRRLSEFGGVHDIDVIVENHGGLSSNGAWLAEVMRTVDHPRCGTLPDFGNFRIKGDEWYDRYQGVRELMPFARAVSAKSHEFDEQGDELRTDYRRMLEIVLAAGYRGYVGIEYEGTQLAEREGILATKKLLEKVRAELA